MVLWLPEGSLSQRGTGSPMHQEPLSGILHQLTLPTRPHHRPGKQTQHHSGRSWGPGWRKPALSDGMRVIFMSSLLRSPIHLQTWLVVQNKVVQSEVAEGYPKISAAFQFPRKRRTPAFTSSPSKALQEPRSGAVGASSHPQTWFPLYLKDQCTLAFKNQTLLWNKLLLNT